MNETYIIVTLCLWAALDIFLHRIFMVYLKVTHISFISKKTDIPLAVPLFYCTFSGVYIYMCVIYVSIPIDVSNLHM